MHITHKEAKKICRLGKGSKCCAFLTIDIGGFECGRKDALVFMAVAKKLKEGDTYSKGEGLWEGCKCLKKSNPREVEYTGAVLDDAFGAFSDFCKTYQGVSDKLKNEEERMSQEKLNHVVCGVLVDFMEWLLEDTSRINTFQQNPVLCALLIDEFLHEKGVAVSNPLKQWADRCSISLLQTPETESLLFLPPKSKKKKIILNKEDKCPFGHVFGVDHGVTFECDECVPNIWESCMNAMKTPDCPRGVPRNSIMLNKRYYNKCPHGLKFGVDFESQEMCADDLCMISDACCAVYESDNISTEKTSENLRNEFAMAALGALAHDHIWARAHPIALAKYAFEIANAMMKEREK